MEIGILGPLTITHGGAPLALPRGKAQRALLLCLLLQRNATVSVDGLVEAVWPADRPATAVKIVQVYVSQWRKLVGDRLETRSPGYLLRVADGELDADRAQALGSRARQAAPAEAILLLDEALALWRGEPLADVRYAPFASRALGASTHSRVLHSPGAAGRARGASAGCRVAAGEVSGTRFAMGVDPDPHGETRVDLPPTVGTEFQLYVNGILQERGIDYQLEGRALVFSRTLIPEVKMSPFEWFLVTFGIGKYRKHDSIDVVYQHEGRNLVAMLRPPEPASPDARA